MFPYWHAQMAYEGLKKDDAEEIPVSLSRSGWAGSQRWGTVCWNGDLSASWASLQASIIGGLSIQLTGIAWWSHDIGGINGNPSDELLVRWFQFGLTSPVFRAHGKRDIRPWTLKNPFTYRAVVKTIRLRRTLRSYVLEQMAIASETGTPMNRPLHWDFPEDSAVWTIHDQYMFGSEYMAVPVYKSGVKSKSVYFPKSDRCKAWRLYAGSATEGADIVHYSPGSRATVLTPLDALPLFECISQEEAEQKQQEQTATSAAEGGEYVNSTILL